MNPTNFKAMAALAAVLMLLSCQQDDDFASAPQPVPPAAEDYTLTEDEAVAIAEGAVIGLKGGKTRVAASGQALTVKTIERVPECTRTGGGPGASSTW